MKQDISIPFLISFLLHGAVFLILSFKFNQSSYIIMPVELSFYRSSGGQAAAAAPAAVAQESRPITKKDDEIVIPKKKTVEKKKKKDKAVKPAEKTAAREDSAKQPQAGSAASPSESKSGGSGAQAGAGSPISVGSARFPYSYYTNLVARKIEKNWQWANAFGQMKAVVFFRILRDGSIAALAIKTSSGDDTFDQQALRSVELAGPFPPLPSGYTEDDLGIYFEFAFKE